MIVVGSFLAAAFKLEVWRVSRVLGQNGINPKSKTPPLPGIEDTGGTLESQEIVVITKQVVEAVLQFARCYAA
jgi:hypothetical protein